MAETPASQIRSELPGDLLPPLLQSTQARIPSLQTAVITPVMTSSLNLQIRQIDVGRPALDEALIKIECTTLCGSVSSSGI